MTPAATPDFVQVQLSAAGISFAGEGAKVTVANGHFSYSFTPGKPVKVLTSEWRRSLSLKSFDGQPIFEIASAASLSAASSAPQGPARIISAPASHTDAPSLSQSKQPAASAAETEVQ